MNRRRSNKRRTAPTLAPTPEKLLQLNRDGATYRELFELYDELPALVRLALKDSPAPHHVLEATKLLMLGHSEEQVVTAIRKTLHANGIKPGS